MQRNLVFVSDYFLDTVRRGAEVCNDCLLYYLDFPTTVESNKLYSIDSTKFYIITNFCNLPETTKTQLIKYKNYLIYEHDHKYISTRNPFLLPNGQQNLSGIVPEEHIINKDFYKNAKVVICQTWWHEQQIKNNLDCITDNIDGSFYLPEDLELLEKIRTDTNTRIDKYAFFNDAEFIYIAPGKMMQQGSNIKNKKGALKYCLDNKLSYMPIPRINDKVMFWKTISKFQHFIFLPDIPETCSRLIIEVKMLGIDLITNQNSGAFHEPWFQLNGQDLIEKFRQEIIPNAVKLFRSYL